MNDLVLGVSDFVAVFNQTLEYAYPNVVIQGELSNFRVSKNRWVYFDLKDEFATVKFFGTVYQLPGPLEDGLLVQVSGQPRLHPQYGFSINIQFIQPVGEGAIRRAAELLEAKLAAEGLFDPSRKRVFPYPPLSVGLITSGESAAYRDFIKILNERWSGVDIYLADTQVQGESAIAQIVAALDYFNTHAEPVDVVVITRGGGSAEDLAVFNVEQVVRAIAGSRIPTMVAIGHEIDVSLAELAADLRASTPSNAAELLVPDRAIMLAALKEQKKELTRLAILQLHNVRNDLRDLTETLGSEIIRQIVSASQRVTQDFLLLEAFNPVRILERGYVAVSSAGMPVKSVHQLKSLDTISLRFSDGKASAIIDKIC